MQPSDLLKHFGNPVAYYPGLVEHLGGVNAVVLFCQLFYWSGKAHSELGVYKTREDIKSETGLTFREQMSARKQLKTRGVLTETNKRLEHRIYYRINIQRLDEILNEALRASRNAQGASGGASGGQNRETCSPRNAQSARRGETKAHAAGEQKRTPPVAETAQPGTTKAHSDVTETTSEITTETTSEITSGRPIGGGAISVHREEAAPPEDGQPLRGETAFQLKCREAWRSYREAYEHRYGTPPVRNAKINGQVKSLVSRLGGEAAPVAAFYVNRINDQYVVRNSHELGLLVAKAESYRTQWATGRAMTTGTARQIDRTQTNANAADEAIRMLEAEVDAFGAKPVGEVEDDA
ncbi:hypothetical protein [Martelella sp. AD-3]|uniref:hypothetical protein n=1 Tax=Martelella sp. AD-3 TaxID=686597 RepID=UPI0004AE8AFE|nr:hypothetical protein [Martelella sp. AD-3]